MTNGMSKMSEQIYAGFWLRVVASLIDTVCVLLITTPLMFLVYGDFFYLLVPNPEPQGFFDILVTYALPAIAIILFWVYRSATPGKMILGLKIIRIDGEERLTPAQSVGRYMGYYLSMLPFFMGFIWVAFDDKKQGWHDKLAGTLVVKADEFEKKSSHGS